MDTLYILQKQEVQLLAAATGIRTMYGLPLGEPLTETDAMYIIHELVRKEVLVEDEEGFRIMEPWKAIFCTIRDAEKTLAVTARDNDVENICIYSGDSLVTQENSRWDENAVRMGNYESEELYSLLSDKSLLPEQKLDYDIALLQSEEDFLASLPEGLYGKLMENEKYYLLEEGHDSSVMVQYLMFSKTEAGSSIPQKAFYLLNHMGSVWVAEKDRNETRFETYTPEGFFEKLRMYL